MTQNLQFVGAKPTTRRQQINQACTRSQVHGTPEAVCVIDNEEGREFFRFKKGELVEYDLTRYSVLDPKTGERVQKIVALTKEEKEAVEAFFETEEA